jgi:hypothetical protein
MFGVEGIFVFSFFLKKKKKMGVTGSAMTTCIKALILQRFSFISSISVVSAWSCHLIFAIFASFFFCSGEDILFHSFFLVRMFTIVVLSIEVYWSDDLSFALFTHFRGGIGEEGYTVGVYTGPMRQGQLMACRKGSLIVVACSAIASCFCFAYG